MKKWIAFLLAALMALTLCSCSDEGEAQGNNELDNFVEDEVVIDSITNEAGETFYFDPVDSDTVTITGYASPDKPHILNIPATLDGKRVVSISANAFYFRSDLTTIIIPNGITEIGDYAFAGCSKVTSISFPASLQKIGNAAFYSCELLDAVVLRGTVEIGSNAFYGCTAMTRLNLPASLRTVGDAAFYGCSALTALTVPSGTEEIGKQAFQDCKALTSLRLPDTLQSIGEFNFTGTEALYIENVVCNGDLATSYIARLNLPKAPVNE